MYWLLLLIVLLVFLTCTEYYRSSSVTCQKCGETNINTYDKVCPQCQGRIVTASVFANPKALHTGLTWVL